MMKLGITGYPLTYTRSPRLHRDFLRKARIKGSYDILPFDPNLGKAAFFRFLDRKRAENYLGLNVTVPFKEWAYEYAKRRGGVVPSPEGDCARLVGAANTLVFGRDGEVRAANTDSIGLWDDLQCWIPRLTKKARSVHLLIVGTGGAARGAVAGILTGHPGVRWIRHVTVWGRDPVKARSLQKLLPAKLKVATVSKKASGLILVLWSIAPCPSRESGVVFLSAVKGAGGPAAGTAALYDLNYGARARGTARLVPKVRRKTGMAMLRRQAFVSFVLWRRAAFT